MTVTILKGDCREVLGTLPAESVHCVVTSPPYFGLRDYGVAGQIGLEASPDAFVDELVAVFRDVRRVLRDDGTVWLNLGDSYATAGTRQGNDGDSLGRQRRDEHRTTARIKDARSKQATNSAADFAAPHRNLIGFKNKDLIGVPWRVAFALQADGWYLRQDIIWSKPNPMPESVRDRCTKAHEYLFLLSKSERYYYDADAIAEPISDHPVTAARNGRADKGLVGPSALWGTGFGQSGKGQHDRAAAENRNRRSVWNVATLPFPDAHFATFPPALIEPCILAGCPKGGTVLDPFGGAGTTGLVADRLGRNAILIELNPDYAAMAERRIRKDAGLFASVAAE